MDESGIIRLICPSCGKQFNYKAPSSQGLYTVNCINPDCSKKIGFRYPLVEAPKEVKSQQSRYGFLENGNYRFICSNPDCSQSVLVPSRSIKVGKNKVLCPKCKTIHEFEKIPTKFHLLKCQNSGCDDLIEKPHQGDGFHASMCQKCRAEYTVEIQDNKIFKVILITILSLFAFSVFADEKLTIRNSDTGESFEIFVPENLKIYQYNSNWLDSVPYLIENAKWMEPWAYEALGDCYRNGNGGVEKSMAFALTYYKLSGKKMGEFLKRTHEDNPDDELGLFSYLMIRFLDGPVLDFENLRKELSSIKKNDFSWLNLIHKLTAMNKGKFSINDLEPLLDESCNLDEGVIILGIIANQKLIDKHEDHPIIKKLIEKLSCVNSILAEDYCEKYFENKTDTKPLLKALENYRIADNQGFLTKNDMEKILYIKEVPGINFYDYFTSEDLERFEKLSKNKG